MAGQQQQPPRILVLAGWVASGKSTFATGLEQLNPDFVRISQDVLGNRPACEAMARKSLAEGKSIIIDRQNFDRKQRLTWIRLASEFASLNAGINLDCDLIEFATPVEECANRLHLRTGHETIKSVQEGMGILKLVSGKEWVPPHISEGFTRHLVLLPPGATSAHPASAPLPFPVTPDGIQSILTALDAIPVTRHPIGNTPQLAPPNRTQNQHRHPNKQHPHRPGGNSRGKKPDGSSGGKTRAGNRPQPSSKNET